MSGKPHAHRKIAVAAIVFITGLLAQGSVFADEADDKALMSRFEYLSENGNSNCSGQFMEAFATMPVTARLQGSCCSPMNARRYARRIRAPTRRRVPQTSDPAAMAG